MKKISFLFLFGFILSSCTKDDDKSQPNNSDLPAALPIACVTVNKSGTIDSSEIFVFTNCSQNAVRYEWDFGDADYAPVANPMHVYNQSGNFIVRMTAYNSDNVPSTAIDTVTVGYYSLDKVIFRQTTTRFPAPFMLRVARVPYFNVQDTFLDQSFLPLTVQLADSSIYDFNLPAMQYVYREDSSASTYIIRNFGITPSSITNDQFDTAFSFGIWDTAKFTMYYKVVYR